MASASPPSTIAIRESGWSPLHETVSADHALAPGDDAVVETGTTIVGLTTAERVVLAADRRASLGGRFVTNKRVRKVEPIQPTAAVALSGAVGGLQGFVRTLRAETALYADRRGEPPTVTALATLAGNVLRSAPLAVTPLLGGVDGSGPRVFSLDPGGGVLGDSYAAGGSGMQVAYGVLEREYAADLPLEEARGVAARAVGSASERDTASGNGLTVAAVTEGGVEIDEYDAVEEVA